MEILVAANGSPTLAHGGHFLEDPQSPEQAAHDFVGPDQVEGARLVVLFGLGLGYRGRRLRELGVERIAIFEPDLALAAFMRENDPAALEGLQLLTDFPSLSAHLLQATIAGHRTMLLVPPAYRRAFPEEHARLKRTLGEVEGLKQLQKNTLVQRFNLTLETGLGNLHQLEHIPLFTEMATPLDGCPAFIVAAGPSLDINAHLLVEAQTRGAVFTVNTAAPAVVAAGAAIDVLTCIESLDVTAHLQKAAAHARLVALDLTANPANFGVEAASRIAFMPRCDPFTELAERLGTHTLPYGASVATAAFALAYHWGANPIVLVGQDLAYTGGRVYAKHTGREGLRATVQGQVLTMDYPPHLLAEFKKHGIKEPGRHRPCVRLPAWGGGEVASTHDMMLFLRWFEAAAMQMGDRTLINATEGGVAIEGFEHRTLHDVLSGLGPRVDSLDAALAQARAVPSERIAIARRDVVSAAKTIERLAKDCMRAKAGKPTHKADRKLLRARKRSTFVEIHCAPELVKLRDDRDVPQRERRERTFAAIRDSAKRVVELISAA